MKICDSALGVVNIWNWLLLEADGITKGSDKLMDTGISEFWRDQAGMGTVTSPEQQLWLLRNQGVVDDRRWPKISTASAHGRVWATLITGLTPQSTSSAP